jgi:hypothetical protein
VGAVRVISALPRVEQPLECGIHLFGHGEKATAITPLGHLDDDVFEPISRSDDVDSLASSHMSYESKIDRVRPR